MDRFTIGTAITLGLKALRQRWLAMLLMFPLALVAMLTIDLIWTKIVPGVVCFHLAFNHCAACHLLHRPETEPDQPRSRAARRLGRLLQDSLALAVIIYAYLTAANFLLTGLGSRVDFGLAVTIGALGAFLVFLWLLGRLALVGPMGAGETGVLIERLRKSFRDTAPVHVRVAVLALLAIVIGLVLAAGMTVLSNAFEIERSLMKLLPPEWISSARPSLVYWTFFLALPLTTATICTGAWQLVQAQTAVAKPADIAAVFE
jgi:hypothetical protein